MSTSSVMWGAWGGYGGWPAFQAPSAPYYAAPVSYSPPSRATDRLRIVYYNDIHEKYRAFPRLKTAFDYYGREAQLAGTDVLKLSAGDWNVGRERDQLILDVLLNNALGIVATPPGNHEYDAGEASLAEGLKYANFKTIATNLHIPPNTALYQRWLDRKLVTGPTVYNTPSGQRYGIVGLSVPQAWKYLNPDAQMDGVFTQNLKDSIKRLQGDINQLKNQGIRRIILVSHSGYKADLQIAKQTRGLSVIVGGHSHTELPGIIPGVNYVPSASGEPVVIVQAGMNGLFGKLDLRWDPWDRVIPLTHNIYSHKDYPDDPAAVALINRFLGPEKTIGNIAAEISHKNSGTEGENGASDKVADSIRWAINKKDTAGVDIAFFRGTELRNDVLKGPFTDRDLAILLPFTDKLVKFKMTGAQVQEALDESARCLKLKENHPGILQVSGLRYTIDKQVGKAVNVQVHNAKLGTWEPLDPKKSYTAATGDFLEKNKKEYTVFKKAPVIARYNFTLRDTFGEYIKSFQGKPVSFPLDGRLKVVSGEKPTWKVPFQSNLKSLATRPLSAFASAHGYTTSQTSLNKVYQPTLQALV